MPDTGYRPHKEENNLVSPGDNRADLSSRNANPGENFEDIINQNYSGGEAGRMLRKAERDTQISQKSGEGSKGAGGRDDPSSRSGRVKDTLMHGLGGKKALKDKEQAAEGGGLFKGDKNGDDGKKKKGSWKKRALIGGVGGLIGAGGFFGIASIVEGPLSVIHFGQLLQGLSLKDNQGQNQGRLLKHLRYMYNLKKGTPERSRLGYLGNKYADSIKAKFEAKGVTYIEDGGAHNLQSGYRFDPEKYGATEGLTDRSPEAVQKYLKDSFGLDAKVTTVDGKVVLDVKNTKLFAARLASAKAFRAVGYRGVIALPYRFAAKRAGWNLHPLAAADRAVQRSIDDKLKAFRDKWSKNIADGTTSTTGTATAPEDPNKPTGAQDVPGTVEELSAEVKAAKDAALLGDRGPLEILANKMSFKISAGAAGLTAIVCMLKSIADVADKIALANVMLPRERIFAAMSATAGQVQHGDDYAHNSPLPEDQVATVAGWLYDAKTQTNATDARPIQALLGLNQSGSDLPEQMKVNPNGNFITRALSVIPDINQICAAVNTTVGVVALTILGLVAAPVSTLAGMLVAAVAGQLGFFTWVAEWLAGAVVPSIPTGELLGNVAMYGGHDSASLDALSSGGSIVSQGTVTAINAQENEFQRKSFQNESLATRMLDINDRRSFIAQVYDSTLAPTPQGTVSKYASGFMNMGQTTLRTFGSIFTSKASAAGSSFTFDTPTVLHTDAQVSDPMVADPFQNADAVAGKYDNKNNLTPGILDGAMGPELIARAKTCQGVNLVTGADPDHPGNSMWSIAPPTNGEIPTYKEIMDPVNKCNDTSAEWLRVQDFIWDSQLGNSYGCYEGDPQACVDVGIKSPPDPGAGTTADTTPVTCNSSATAAPPQIAGYKLVKCADFDGTALPTDCASPTGCWTAYSKGGEGTVVDKNTSRQPGQCVVANGLLSLVQDAAGHTCGVSSNLTGTSGYWEVRMRAYTTAPAGAGGAAPHPVLILWPDAENWNSGGGELDYAETDIGKKPADVGVFLHCAKPGQSSQPNCFSTTLGVDPGQWHNYGFKWEAGAAPGIGTMTGYVDNVQKYSTDGKGSLPPGSMHQTIQLDCIGCSVPVAPGKMEVDWVHQYTK